jgi:hypothetical protein
MPINLYQIIIIAFSSIMIYQGIAKYFKKESGQTLYKLSIRIIVWGGMALVATFPRITNSIAKFIGIEGNINAVILIGFLLVFLMIFKLLSAIERLEQDISKITRQESLKTIKKK